MSTFKNLSIGLSVTYEYQFSQSSWVSKATLNYELDHLRFEYADFRNVLADAPVGDEPLFQFSANVTRIFASFWY
jgi:hypothetical protein